jgi:DnaJ family protein A protein 2
MSDREYYDVLGVKKTATTDEITKAYRELAKVLHPDKPTGNAEKFKALKAAYEVLKNEKTREIYDRYGKKGLENGGMEAENPFEALFNPQRRKGTGPTKGEATVHNLRLTLEQLYTGCTKKLAIRRQVLCGECKGHGGPKEKKFTCKVCKGRGQRIELKQLGPSMMQQVQMPCDECNGVGEGFEEKDKCKTCRGKGSIANKEIIEVHVPPGTENGKQFTFYEKGDESLNVMPGDLIVVIQQEKHPLFKRQGANLFLAKTISLAEALVGFEFQLVHLDGHKLSVKSRKGLVVSPGTVQVVRSQGMPMGHGSEMGDLYFEYDVVFPKSINLKDGDSQILQRILGAEQKRADVVMTKTVSTPADEDVRMEDEDAVPEDVDLQEERQKWQEQMEQAKAKHGATEEDDERPQTQCRAQ